MKIEFKVGVESFVEFWGEQGGRWLQYIFYNELSYDNLESIEEVYYNSRTQKRYMERMIKRYGNSIRNFKK